MHIERFTSLRKRGALFLQISRDDSLVSIFSNATVPRHHRCPLRFFSTPDSSARAVAATRASYWHLLYDIGSIGILAGTLYLMRDNLCTRREIRLIISRDKSVGRGNYELPYSRSQNSTRGETRVRRMNCIKYCILLERMPFSF